MNFSWQIFFKDINRTYRTAILKKNSSLAASVAASMYVAAYFVYEKVRRTMRTAIVSYLLKRIIKFRNFLPSVNLSLRYWFSGAAVHWCFSKKVFFKISQHSQKSIYGLILQDTCGGCFWIFAAANTFFSWIWYLLLTVAPAFALNSFENTS